MCGAGGGLVKGLTAPKERGARICAARPTTRPVPSSLTVSKLTRVRMDGLVKIMAMVLPLSGW